MAVKTSPYSTLITAAIAQAGGSFDILKDYPEVVAKTTVTYWVNRSSSEIAYYDPKGLLLCSASGNPDDFPHIGKVEEINKRKNYQKDYDSRCTNIHLKFAKNDADIIDYLDTVPNKQGLIKRLLREEIKRQADIAGNARS